MAANQVNKGFTGNAGDDVAPSAFGKLLGNTKLLGIIAAVIVVAGAGIWYLRYSRAKSNQSAQTELSRVRGYYDKGEYAVAIAGDPAKKINGQKVRGLKEIADDYSGTPTGELAALYLGNSYIGTGQVDKAGQYYSAAAGSSDPTVSAAGHAGLAAVAEAGGKYDQAAQEYLTAAESDKLELNAPDYLLGSARNFERANKKDEAVKQYKRVATQFAESQANAEARLALARYSVEL